MNTYLVMPIVQSIFAAVLIVFVIRGRVRSPVHRLFSLYLLALAVWGGLIFAMRVSPDVEHAYTWEKVLIPMAPLSAVIFYHFTIRFTGVRVANWWLPLAYVVCLLFASIAGTKLLFAGMQTRPFGYAPIPGPAMPLLGLFSYAMMILALFALFKSSRTSSSAVERNRNAYVFAGVVISLVGGAFDILTLAGLPLYPGAIIGNIVFCLITTVAIVKHSLLDIHVVLRKGTAYILASVLIAIPFVAVFLLVAHFFEEIGSSPWVYFLLLIALAFILPQLWQWIQRWVEKWFYRDRYNYLKALGTFSQETQSITDFTKLGSTMVKLLTGALRTLSIHLLQPLPLSGEFTVTFSSDLHHSSSHIILKRESPLVKWLERSKEMLYYEDINIIPQLQGITSKEMETLQQLRTKLIIGLKTSTGRLSGVLILGPKLSEQPYTVEDKQLIYTVCNQMSTNLENARLYNESQQEVEERKRAEEILRENEEKLRRMFESVTDGISVIDLNGIITDVNQRTVEIHGFNSKDELLGRSAFQLVAPRDHKRVTNNMRQTIKRGVIRGMDCTLLRADGSEFLGELSTSVLKDASGNPVSHITIARDITERKLAEEKEKRLQEELNLAGRLAAIGELAAGVAHEINNPLTAVLAFSERLLRRSTDEKTTKDLKIIHNEARRTAKVVENLLTFARRRESEKQYANINDIVQKALELRAFEFKSANIEVITELAPNLPQVVVDFHQIQEVFLNIILNAEQAMTSAKGGGKLSIKTQQMGGHIKISFTDTGPGIPTEHLDKVFNPFFSTKGEIGGTGLGLSICHGIVTEHGGRIYVESEPGKGTTFFVDLPLAREEKDRSKVVHKEMTYR